MTTNIKEMSFSELNIMIADFNKQMEEIRNKMEEAVSERQNRQEEAINNWKLHTAQVLEDTRILLEMGIDPHTLSPLMDEDGENNDINTGEPIIEPSGEVSERMEPEITGDEETLIKEDKEDNINSDNDEEIDKETCISPSVIEDERKEETEIKGEDEMKEQTSDTYLYDDKHDNPILTPFYKLFKLPVIIREKTVKKETVDTRVNPFTGRRMVGKILKPFYKLYTDNPIKSGLKLGNLKFKKSFPDPEETRVVSADGYSPTLTYTHSDFWVWIGPEYDENGNMISESTGIDEMKDAA